MDVAMDAFGALDYLRSLPFVDGGRVGVMGFSYGAEAALEAGEELRLMSVRLPAGGFRLAVSFYPWCGWSARPPISIPVLLLLGEADTDSPAVGCVEWAKRGQAAGRTVLVTVYPRAHHGFDMAELGTRTLVNARGHVMRYDPEATADAQKRIRAFLAEHMRRAP